MQHPIASNAKAMARNAIATCASSPVIGELSNALAGVLGKVDTVDGVSDGVTSMGCVGVSAVGWLGWSELGVSEDGTSEDGFSVDSSVCFSSLIVMVCALSFRSS